MSGYHYVKCSHDPDRFWSYVDMLNEGYLFASYSLSSSAQEYAVARLEDSKTDYYDISTIILSNGDPIWCLFGTLVKPSGDKERPTLQYYEHPFSTLEAKNLTKAQEKIIKQYIDDIFIEHSCFAVYEEYLLGPISLMTSYLLTISNHSKEITYTRIADLSIEEKYLRSNIRKSYLSLINWGTKNLNISVHYLDSCEWDNIEKFRQLHKYVAGRQTRSLETWKRQYEAIRAGHAFCVTGEYENKLITAGFFGLGFNHCIYGVSASDRQLFDKPLFHALMWRAMQFAKAKKANYFETGFDYIDPESIALRSDKEMKIALFKSGFGGDLYLKLKITV